MFYNVQLKIIVLLLGLVSMTLLFMLLEMLKNKKKTEKIKKAMLRIKAVEMKDYLYAKKDGLLKIADTSITSFKKSRVGLSAEKIQKGAVDLLRLVPKANLARLSGRYRGNLNGQCNTQPAKDTTVQSKKLTSSKSKRVGGEL
jgi:hypothetical protein